MPFFRNPGLLLGVQLTVSPVMNNLTTKAHPLASCCCDQSSEVVTACFHLCNVLILSPSHNIRAFSTVVKRSYIIGRMGWYNVMPDDL